ncbi:TIGR02117 family protein [Pedobacter frigidisoli]|uniref:TIGR02117 family protein n=1 Tax=Pedobacter frigidisoli TaxID=2530455 RepID=A0A4R0P4K2_9SPHI|nr:TIGR02117 family protein [Pedobacter frigidisoli]TCD11529.1 TIGR02117 family protein [Pedobacter frigidisoli]
MNKKFLRLTGRFTVSFVALIALFFILAFCFSRVTINPYPTNKKEVTIYVMSNGVHTDIVVPAKNTQKDWTNEIKYSNTLSADSTYQYLAIGWGDKKFYLETPEFKDLKLSTALRAISGLSTSAMHTTYYRGIVEDSLCKKMMISKTQYEMLISYISKSFEVDAKGHILKVNTNIHYDYGDAFYEAKGSYSILKTCNTWTNSALKACEQKACLWTIFDTPILSKY